MKLWPELRFNVKNTTYKTKLEMDPRTCILGLWEERNRAASTIKAILRCLFQATKLIAQRLQAENPSSVREWVNAVTETIWKEKVVYTKRRNIRVFDKIWNPWLEKMGNHM